MRRVALTSVLVAAVAALALFGVAAEEEDSDTYLVRAAFDNGSFVVEDEEVRIAGARVGVVESVDVSGEDEIVSLEPRPNAQPGKAIIVMRIEDRAFQDFRSDASCIIRPQSLLGEKFIECEPTQARAPGSEPPPPLQTIEEGPGEGQRLLPVEQTMQSIDLDLVQNIMRRPYRERFSIILNELGAGLAARGPELAEVIERANPALRETDRVLAILAEQNKTLSRLARDSDQVLAPLARDRESVSGFISNAGQTASAAAERRADIETGFERLPESLRQLRATMAELRSFSDQATPVVSDLGDAAPSLAGATRALGPLAEAANPALKTLGDAARESEAGIVASDPVIRDLRGLADASERPAVNLRKLLASVRGTGGYEYLLDFLLGAAGAVNGFDRFGHVLRTQLLVTNCTDYVITPLTGCNANFVPDSRSTGTRDLFRFLMENER